MTVPWPCFISVASCLQEAHHPHTSGMLSPRKIKRDGNAMAPSYVLTLLFPGWVRLSTLLPLALELGGTGGYHQKQWAGQGCGEA